MQRGAIRGMAFWGAPPGLASPSADDVELALALGFEDPCSVGPLSEAGEEHDVYIFPADAPRVAPFELPPDIDAGTGGACGPSDPAIVARSRRRGAHGR